MRNKIKANWTSEDWAGYINEASETANNLEKLGAKSIVADWKKIAVDRENEYKNFNRPAIPYQY